MSLLSAAWPGPVTENPAAAALSLNQLSGLRTDMRPLRSRADSAARSAAEDEGLCYEMIALEYSYTEMAQVWDMGSCSKVALHVVSHKPSKN